MIIFTKEQCYEIDDFTIKNQGITSDELMERASNQVFNWIDRRLEGQQVKLHVFCGVGNNGGDGLAITRLLMEHGYNVATHIVNFSGNRSKDFLINLDRLKELKYWPESLNKDSQLPGISQDEIVIDCIFGIGLNRQPADWVGDLIKHINTSQAFVLSVDVPSGLYLDAMPEQTDYIVRANHCLTFQFPKLVFLLPQTGVYVNQWEILDIGLDLNFLKQAEPLMHLINKPDVLPIYQPRRKFAHKGDYGHVLIVGGSYGKIGAPLMAAEASLHVGAGLVTGYIPKCGYQIFQTSFPEAMVITDKEDEVISNISYDTNFKAIAIGPGMGIDEKTVNAYKAFLNGMEQPLVIDADAINILAKHKELIDSVPEQSVLTPHPKELERLIGAWKDDFDKLEKAKHFSKEHNLIVVIKGAHTITVYGDRLFVNNTGNPGMATGGSGDVLTGIIAGLAAQGYSMLNAAIFGVYLHGTAGDLGVEKTGYQALTATTIIDFIGDAFLDLFKRETPIREKED